MPDHDGRCCVEIIEVAERNKEHEKRLDAGDGRMTRIESKIDHLIFVQYGALLTGLVALAIGAIKLSSK